MCKFKCLYGDLVPFVHVGEQVAQLAVALMQDLVAGGADLVEGGHCTAQHLPSVLCSIV